MDKVSQLSAFKMPPIPKCPRCNMGFGTKDTKYPHSPRTPLMLDCGHTFCADCLMKLAKQQKTIITCPTCKKSTGLSEDSSIRSLWHDVYMEGLMAIACSGLVLQPQVMEFMKPNSLSANKAKPKISLCEECSVKAATCRCIKCEVVLCGACFEKIHSVSNVLRQHQAEPYSSKNSIVSYGRNERMTCESHKRSNEYYCTDEDVAFCALCAGQGLHKDHSVVTLGDKERRDATDLNALIGLANNVLQKSKQSSQLLSSVKSTCRTHGSGLIEKLQEHFLQLHSLLQAREHCLISELVNLFQTDIGSLVETTDNFMEQIEKMEMVISDARAVIAGRKPQLTCHQVIERMEEIVEIPCIAAVAGGANNMQIQFRCDDEKLLNEIGSHGLWDGRFKTEVKFDKLCDVLVTMDAKQELPTVRPYNDSNSIENFISENKANVPDRTLPIEDSDISFIAELRNKPKTEPLSDKRGKPAVSRTKIRCEVIHMSHIRNPCSFYVNLSRDIQTLTSLSQNINTHCSSVGRRDIPDSLTVGDRVLAQFGQDGQWYRAQVIEVNERTPVSPETIQVLYTDYGNTELITLDRIRNIHPKFLRLPNMAYHCSLVDIVPVDANRWSNEAINIFAQFTKDRPMLLSLIKETVDLWYVDLSRPASEEIEDDGPVSVRDALIFLGLACFASSCSMPSTRNGGFRRRCYMTPILPQCGDSVRVSLSYVVTPHDFYVQMLGSDSRHFQDLMADIQKTYEEDHGDLYTLFCPAKGMLCVARYEVDKMWYRAEVVDLLGCGQISIKYVDYGNIETVSVWSLKKLLDVYAILPTQAVNCRLADVGPLNESGLWDPEATCFLAKLLSEAELSLKIKEVIDRSTLSVYLHSEVMLHSVNTFMISNGWAVANGCGPGLESPRKTAKSLFKIAQRQKTQAENDLSKAKRSELFDGSRGDMMNEEPAEVAKSCPIVTVSHVISPGEFYVQDVEKVDALEKLRADLQKYFLQNLDSEALANGSDVSGLRLGNDLCAVYSQSDKGWYRARITRNCESSESAIEVLCFDFGYKLTVDVSGLRPLPDSMVSIKPFALCCHFAEIVPAGDSSRWPQTSCESFASLVSGKTCYLVAKANSLDDLSSWPVDLLFEERIKGGALTPDVVRYVSVADSLRQKGLALKKRVSCQPVSSSSDSLTAQNGSGQNVEISDTAASPQALNVSVPVQSSSCGSAKDEGMSLSQSLPLLEATSDDYPPPECPSSDKFVLGVTHVDPDCIIYGQEIKSDLRYLQQLKERVDNCYKNSSPNIGCKWKEGQLAIAQYTEDDDFYRAKVLSVSDNFAEVYYVDYGNKERISVERLRPAMFTNEPAQCYRCQLQGLKWISLQEASKFLYSLLVSKVSSVHVKEQAEPGQPLVVQIVMSDGKDVSRQLCDAGFACEEKRSVVSHDLNPSVASLRPVSSTVRVSQPLESVSISLKSPFSQTDSGHHSKSGAVNDHVDKHSSVTPVPAVESLQTLSMSMLRSCGNDLPVFPHPCGYGSWMDDVDNFPPQDSTSPVLKRTEPSPYFQMPRLNIGDMMTVTVTQVDTPHMVYLQRVKVEDVVEHDDAEVNHQLDRLLELNIWYGSNFEQCPTLKADNVKPGYPCIAKYSLNSRWYRAEITDVQHNEESATAYILCVDYGFSDCITDLSRLRAIPSEHMSLPAQAVLCHLNGVVPRESWNGKGKDSLEALVKDKVLRARVKNVENGEMSIDLFDRDVHSDKDNIEAPLVYQPLIDSGILMFSKSTVTSASALGEASSESGNLEHSAFRNSSEGMS